jgi:hypothetical protein
MGMEERGGCFERQNEGINICDIHNIGILYQSSGEPALANTPVCDLSVLRKRRPGASVIIGRQHP